MRMHVVAGVTPCLTHRPTHAARCKPRLDCLVFMSNMPHTGADDECDMGESETLACHMSTGRARPSGAWNDA